MQDPYGRGARVEMVQIRMAVKTFAGVVLLLGLFAAQALAEEETPKKLDLSAAFRYSLPIGEEEPGVDWDDLYDNGIGGALEVTYRATPRVGLYIGGAYHLYRAKDITLDTPTGPVSGRFNDQELFSLYLGVKTYLLGAALPQKSGGIDPYLRADIGLSLFNDTNFNGSSVADRSGELAFSVGLGVDLLTYTNFIFFLEAKYEDHGVPDKAGDSFRAMPFAVGMRYLM